MKKYDYLLIGAGLFNSIFAYEAVKRGKKCLVIDKRTHIGGNCYTEKIKDINVHLYGAHIFRTDSKKAWDYLQRFATFNHFVNAPIAVYHDEVYNLPFNMNTFSRMWNIMTPEEAKAIIDEQRKEIQGEPQNLEEKAISLVGRDIYTKLIREYTEKQWGRECRDLPASILRRLPVRFTYDNNYYNDRFQGIPEGGYTPIFEQLLSSADVELNCSFKKDNLRLSSAADRIICTGPIDEYYQYRFGPLEYRSLRFEHRIYETDNYQGVAVMNFTSRDVPYTRRIEHKHFEFGRQKGTVISYEYSHEWKCGNEPFYPINDQANISRHRKYLEYAANKDPHISFCGRLGTYQYTDMQDTVLSALHFAEKEFEEKIL